MSIISLVWLSLVRENREPLHLSPDETCNDFVIASETNLSLEEQRLMQSIERINQRLKGEINLSAQELQVATSQLPSLDHLKASDAPELKTQYYYPVPPSTAPKRPPTQSHHHPVRVRGLAEATKPGQNTVKPHGVNSRNHPSLSYYKQSSHIT